MPTLYELTGERLQLARKLESLDLDAETIADTLEGESTVLEAKITDYGYVIRNRNSFANEIEEEIVRLQERLHAERTRVMKIEDWLLQNMQACGISKIECPAFTVSVLNNPVSVDVLDIAIIPMAYMRQPEIKIPHAQPDKKLIAAAIKSGLEVAGCALKQSTRLEIK